MTVAAVPDAEFIELYKHHASPTILAKILNVAVRNVCQRRERIERKYNIQLPTRDPSNRPKHHSQEIYNPVLSHKIKDGQIIVASDLHFWPGVRTTAFNALLHFIVELRPSMVVVNGDAFDGAAISRHPRIGWERVPSVIQELNACKASLGEMEEHAGRARLVWCLGNHDARFSSRLAAVAPEFHEVTGFQLKDHFPEWEPCWRLDVNDDVVIKHRIKNGVHATHLNTLNSGKTTVTGHLHQLKVTPFSDFRGNRYGVDTGTVADVDGPQFTNYTESGPLNWRSGFAILTFKDGKLLMPQLVQKWDNDHVEFAGQIIRVSQWSKRVAPVKKPNLAKRSANEPQQKTASGANARRAA